MTKLLELSSIQSFSLQTLDEESPKNELGHVHQPIGNFMKMKTIYPLVGVKKAKKKTSEPKNGIWSPKSVWSCDISIRNLLCSTEKYAFKGQNSEN
jgi:hypothetical protein